jgi:small subunit ribosomal protein S16
MIKLRLSRSGSKANTFYRIVATEKTKKVCGKALDVIGYWQPSKSLLQLDKEKVSFWVKKGASITKSLEDLIKK